MKLTRRSFLAGAAACAAAPAFAKTPDEIRSVLLHWGLNMWGVMDGLQKRGYVPPQLRRNGSACHSHGW